MPSPTRFLQSSGHLAAADPPGPLAVDSDVVVILAALLCALICVVGLALVARCAWLRRSSPSAQPLPPTKGLKKKALRSLPTLSFDGSTASAAAAAGGKLAECPICLAEFAAGDEIRILPHCGHGFHVACVDTWLASHSSCPSCRQILVVPTPSRCPRCGATSAASTAAAEGGAKAGENGEFLP
ncbi:probable E3 ubiquitin-protein ligase ATL44 [Elaeis guineensis]|uniref:Probable E3 ubiquitin-protein ligase ATL44 n=1 Tax=Elaeis guineensis var. tenera TaxID=51953 RepID=A0A6I9QLP8_ELAGV|nr:probable E3 ubiquitin-protein ligase ATL44 [Elaeis guineensis]